MEVYSCARSVERTRENNKRDKRQALRARARALCAGVATLGESWRLECEKSETVIKYVVWSMLHAYEVGGHGIGRADLLFQTWTSHLTFYNISFLSALITRHYHITLITHRYIFHSSSQVSTPIILPPLDLSSRQPHRHSPTRPRRCSSLLRAH